MASVDIFLHYFRFSCFLFSFYKYFMPISFCLSTFLIRFGACYYFCLFACFPKVILMKIVVFVPNVSSYSSAIWQPVIDKFLIYRNIGIKQTQRERWSNCWLKWNKNKKMRILAVIIDGFIKQFNLRISHSKILTSSAFQVKAKKMNFQSKSFEAIYISNIYFFIFFVSYMLSTCFFHVCLPHSCLSIRFCLIIHQFVHSTISLVFSTFISLC